MASARKPCSAAIYARISLDKEGEQLGVERQRKDCRKLARDRGWTVIDEYVDNDLSASKRNITRPEYERLKGDIKAGIVDAVIVWDLDRLTRQPRELEAFMDLCEDAGLTEVATIGDAINLGTGDGVLVARIKGAVAAEEARKISMRVKRQILEAAENGQPKGGGVRPYGFAPNRIDHDPSEAAALRSAADVVLDGGTLAEAARLTGLRPESVKRILLSPRVAGLRQHHGEVIGQAVWAPIISRADWERLKGLLQRPTRYSVPTKRHLLSGIAKCECGANLSAQHKKNPERTVYICRSTRGGCGKVAVDAAHLERTVTVEVGKWLTNAKVRRAVQRHLDGAPDDREVELVDLISADEALLADLATKRGELALTTVEWAAMRRPVLARIEQARAELSKLHRRPVRVKVDLGQIARRWSSIDDLERRDWFHDLGVDVTVLRAGKAARRFNAERVIVTPGWASL